MITKQKHLYIIFSINDPDTQDNVTLCDEMERGNLHRFCLDLEDLVSIGPPVLIEVNSCATDQEYREKVLEKLPHGANGYVELNVNIQDYATKNKVVQYYHVDMSKYFLARSNDRLRELNNRLEKINR